MRIPFSRPHAIGTEWESMRAALEVHGRLSGNGYFTQQCQQWLQAQTGSNRALLTHSCTGALEMSALLLEIAPGDEVIMPSYTFVSTANAFVLRGGVPVFVDITPDTLNIDPDRVEAAITDRTRAICAVHYGGISCNMKRLLAIARAHGLSVVEDAAQAIGASYEGQLLGTLGRFGALSFHDTKNVISGEGGALLINEHADAGPAEIILEKGTNREQYIRGEVDKYTWWSIGSSFLPSELTAAYLWEQLQEANTITDERLRIWTGYDERLVDLEEGGLLRRMTVPDYAGHNAHMYYVLLPSADRRNATLAGLQRRGIGATFHYVPLHSSPAGRRFGRQSGSLRTTDERAARIVRLPLWIGMGDAELDAVVSALAAELTHDSART